MLNVYESFAAFIYFDDGKEPTLYYPQVVPAGMAVTILNQIVPAIGDWVMVCDQVCTETAVLMESDLPSICSLESEKAHHRPSIPRLDRNHRYADHATQADFISLFSPW